MSLLVLVPLSHARLYITFILNPEEEPMKLRYSRLLEGFQVFEEQVTRGGERVLDLGQNQHLDAPLG